MNLINNCSQSSLDKIVLINQQEVKLSLVYKRGSCFKCQSAKEIRLIARRNGRSKEYCWSCSLNALCQLEQNNYQFTDKDQIIKELREELNSKQVKKVWLDYYSCKKPACFTCLQQGIKESEYNFCGENCLVRSWIKYQSQSNLKGKVESYINN